MTESRVARDRHSWVRSALLLMSSGDQNKLLTSLNILITGKNRARKVRARCMRSNYFASVNSDNKCISVSLTQRFQLLLPRLQTDKPLQTVTTFHFNCSNLSIVLNHLPAYINYVNSPGQDPSLGPKTYPRTHLGSQAVSGYRIRQENFLGRGGSAPGPRK